ncbi:MAG: ATP-dependent DNA helicase [Saprospirales bacterium TMED214]|nr:MAG: ATP-dependent DNA helicase [Saprospirales bacterium TMED214]
MDSYLNALNDPQRDAVTHQEGPLLIVAGPGSGKTRVLTYRIAHLIQQGVDPFSILSLTFTNKAAGEMRSRIAQICGDEARNLYMGTFHSVFARILRVEGQRIGYPSNFTIYDTADSRSVIKGLVKQYGLDEKKYKPNQVFSRISQAKNSLLTYDIYQEDPEIQSEDLSSGRPKTGFLFEQYVKKCHQSGAMDFDDLLVNFYKILNSFPDALYRYQHRFQHLLIDEFQDTNVAQYAIVKKLAAVHHNITVVGDDAQSIYSFRGATIDNILNFERDFPELQTIKLEQNYRSTKAIVKAANAIIKENRNQIPKEIWTSNAEGNPIEIFRAASDNEEGKIVADRIVELSLQQHIQKDKFAILYRTNAQSRSFEESLRRLNIPYRIYGGLSFYQRKEVKDLLAYLRLLVNPNDEEALRRVINYPKRGIGLTTIERINLKANALDTTMWDVVARADEFEDLGRSRASIQAFGILIQSFQTMLDKKNAYDIAFHIAKTTKILAELNADKSIEGISRYENILELLNGIKEFVEEDTVQDGEEFSNDRSLGAYLQNIALLTGDENEKSDEPAVNLMTIHSAKGLEFPVVFVVGLEEGLFPNQMSIYDREDLEEERRLFYVAVTRAEKLLSLSFANTRYRFGNLQFCDPSRFINEVPREVLAVRNQGSPPPSSQPNTALLLPCRQPAVPDYLLEAIQMGVQSQ